MSIPRSLRPAVLALAPLAGVACQGYAPEPIDLDAHARAFAARVPTSASVAELVARLHERAPSAPALTLDDGLQVGEARLLALLFNPELREQRHRAGVAQASRDEAGRWQDPELRADLARILEDVVHPWLGAVEVGLTIPITGRPGLERALAEATLRVAWAQARAAETRVLDEVELRFAEGAAARERERLLVELVARLRDIEAIASRLAAAREITNASARVFTLERVSREGELLRQGAAVADLELSLHELLGLPPAAAVAFAPQLRIELREGEAAARGQQAAAGPRLAALLAEYQEAERSLELAVRKQWPELTLFPGMQWEDGDPRLALGVGLPLGLWNRNAREIAQARASRALAGERLRGVLERTLQDLARAELALHSAAAQRRQVEDQLVPLVEQQVSDGRRLAELGQLDPLLLLDSLVRQHEAKVQVLEAALAEARATARVNSFSWAALSGLDSPLETP